MYLQILKRTISLVIAAVVLATSVPAYALAPGTRFTGELRPGARFGKYEILKRIESGGMAKVYLARDTQSGRLVAIKVISEDLANFKEDIDRFKEEAKMQARLKHPSIPKVYETGVIDGRHFISMQYVQGRALIDVILEGGVSFEKALEITEKVARVLDYVHGQGIIHLDIKPGNILVDDKGNVYLFDFGLAAILPEGGGLIRTERILGTPKYLSPDAIIGFVDRRSDVYSLGVVLYKMLTGRCPFEEGDSLHSLPPLPTQFNPRIPEAVEEIVLEAIDKEPNARYQTAGEFADAIRAYLATEAMPFVSAHRLLTAGQPAERTFKLDSIRLGSRESDEYLERVAHLAQDGALDDAAKRKTSVRRKLPISKIHESLFVRTGYAGVAKSTDKRYLLSMGAEVCILCSLYDPKNKIGAMIHIHPFNKVKPAFEEALKQLEQRGADVNNLEARMMGDPTFIMPLYDVPPSKMIIYLAKLELADRGIRLVEEDIGEGLRSIFLDLETGEAFDLDRDSFKEMDIATMALVQSLVETERQAMVQGFAQEAAYDMLRLDRNRRAIAGSMLAPGSRFDMLGEHTMRKHIWTAVKSMVRILKIEGDNECTIGAGWIRKPRRQRPPAVVTANHIIEENDDLRHICLEQLGTGLATEGIIYVEPSMGRNFKERDLIVLEPVGYNKTDRRIFKEASAVELMDPGLLRSGEELFIIGCHLNQGNRASVIKAKFVATAGGFVFIESPLGRLEGFSGSGIFKIDNDGPKLVGIVSGRSGIDETLCGPSSALISRGRKKPASKETERSALSRFKTYEEDALDEDSGFHQFDIKGQNIHYEAEGGSVVICSDMRDTDFIDISEFAQPRGICAVGFKNGKRYMVFANLSRFDEGNIRSLLKKIESLNLNSLEMIAFCPRKERSLMQELVNGVNVPLVDWNAKKEDVAVSATAKGICFAGVCKGELRPTHTHLWRTFQGGLSGGIEKRAKTARAA